MPEWLYEDGIGEARAALVENGVIIAIRIARDNDGAMAGSILPARLLSQDKAIGAVVTLPSGEEAILRQLPPRVSIGATLMVEIQRCAIPERDLTKRAIARAVGAGVEPRALTLRSLVEAGTNAVRTLDTLGTNELESAGWSEALDVARSGIYPFEGGTLRVSLTPAMTVIDIDGYVPATELATQGAHAVSRVLNLLDITGNIVVDFPAAANKAERVRVAEIIDAHAPHPLERTAINGYGLLQIIRPRTGPSIAERVQFLPIESAALALLRRAERAVGTQALTLTAHPSVLGWIDQRPALLEQLQRRTGRNVVLARDAQCGIDGGHAQ